MVIFTKELGLIELLLPAVCIGVIFLGIVFIIYIYKMFPRRLYLAMLYMSVFALIFVISELMILAFGGWLKNSEIAVQFHRVEQLAGVFFLFALPYLLYNLLTLNPLWLRITKYIAFAGLGIAVLITISAFVSPDSFISMTVKHPDWLVTAAKHGRGSEGFLYSLRDLFLGFAMLYALACLIADIIIHKKLVYISMPLAGILLGIAGAVDDIVYVHTGSYILFFPDITYSRFSLGITLFVTMSISSLIKQFTEQAKEVDRAYTSIGSAYKSLQNSEERFKQIAQNISECIVVWDYINKIVSYVSPSYEKITGRSCDALYENPQSWINIIFEEDRDEILRMMSPAAIREREDMQYRIVCTDGNIRWIRHQMVGVRDKFDKIYRLISIIEDITDRKRNEEELIYIAYHDILTGLPNRRAFFERFQELIHQSQRDQSALSKALFFIDIDRFKNINDILGHQFGDMLLKEVPNRIKKCLRGTDYIFHLGGDEFTVLLYGVTEDVDAAFVAQKLLIEFKTPFNIKGRDIFLGLSIGISIFPRDGDNVDALVKNSDVAMHNAKIEGNSYLFFNDEMNRLAVEKLNIENNLRGAAENGQFRLFYQPLVDSDHKIVAMEALIRWNHPELGFVSPDRFIPIAEATGHIIEIGLWTIDEACRQLMVWREKGFNRIRVAVNLSANHLRDDRLIEDITRIFMKYKTDPASLELEITESAVMKDPDLAIDKINRLNEMGVSFSIDDFGTGYSSLSYLKKFRISNLKLDRSFVRDINIDQNNTEITKAIIAMAHNLRLKVIAEGIETVEQMNFLQAMNCDLMQGYLFSRPLPPDEFEQLLKTGIKILP